LESKEDFVRFEWRNKDTGEPLTGTKCPKCGEHLVLFPGELTAAYPLLDERVGLSYEKPI
jgi:hypothetical protein